MKKHGMKMYLTMMNEKSFSMLINMEMEVLVIDARDLVVFDKPIAKIQVAPKVKIMHSPSNDCPSGKYFRS